MAEEEVFCFCLWPQPKTILCVINMNFYADAKGTGFRLSGGSIYEFLLRIRNKYESSRGIYVKWGRMDDWETADCWV